MHLSIWVILVEMELQTRQIMMEKKDTHADTLIIFASSDLNEVPSNFVRVITGENGMEICSC